METKNDSKTTETDVKITDLIIDLDLQMRVKGHEPEYIADLVKATQADKLPPIEGFRDPDGRRVWVADGHARVAAAKEAGRATIRARVHPGGRNAAFEFALGANRTHGARRTPEDLHNAVRKALTDPTTAKYSSRVIARKCDCSDRYVRNVRDALAPTDGAQEARVEGEDGKTYAAKPPRRTGGADSPHLNGGTSVAGSPPQSMTHALASTDLGAGSTVTVTKGVPTEASHDGLSAEVTTPTNSVRVVHEFVGVIPVEPPAALLGDGSHAVNTPGEGEPTKVQTPATVAPDATVVSAPEDVIPSITTPSALGEDMEALLGQLLSTCTKIHARRQSQPEVTVREDLVREAREKVVRCLDECYPDTRDTVHGKLTDAPARFRDMMGYNPRPGHASDEAVLDVLAEELHQERLSA